MKGYRRRFAICAFRGQVYSRLVLRIARFHVRPPILFPSSSLPLRVSFFFFLSFPRSPQSARTASPLSSQCFPHLTQRRPNQPQYRSANNQKFAHLYVSAMHAHTHARDAVVFPQDCHPSQRERRAANEVVGEERIAKGQAGPARLEIHTHTCGRANYASQEVSPTATCQRAGVLGTKVRPRSRSKPKTASTCQHKHARDPFPVSRKATHEPTSKKSAEGGGGGISRAVRARNASGLNGLVEQHQGQPLNGHTVCFAG